MSPARPTLIIAPIVTVSPAHTTSELPPDSPSPLQQKVSSPSAQSSHSKTSAKLTRPTSAGGIFNRFRRPSSQQSSIEERNELSSSKSPISQSPPVLREIQTEADEESLNIFNQNATLPRMSSRHRGGSLQEKSYSQASNPQIPISASLPRDYGSGLLRLTPCDGNETLISSSESCCSASDTTESTSSNSSSLTRSKAGSIDAATLDALIEQLISDSSGKGPAETSTIVAQIQSLRCTEGRQIRGHFFHDVLCV